VKLVRRDDGAVLMLAHGKVIGRTPQTDLQVDDGSISRRHARVDQREGRWFLVDLGSSNGSLRNGERLKEFELRPGDLVTLGAVAFQVEGERSTARPAAAPVASKRAAGPSHQEGADALQPSGGTDRERARLRAELGARGRSKGFGDLSQQPFYLQLLIGVVALAFLGGVAWLVLQLGHGLER